MLKETRKKRLGSQVACARHALFSANTGWKLVTSAWMENQQICNRKKFFSRAIEHVWLLHFYAILWGLLTFKWLKQPNAFRLSFWLNNLLCEVLLLEVQGWSWQGRMHCLRLLATRLILTILKVIRKVNLKSKVERATESRRVLLMMTSCPSRRKPRVPVQWALSK